jgi:hypothetical protein
VEDRTAMATRRRCHSGLTNKASFSRIAVRRITLVERANCRGSSGTARSEALGANRNRTQGPGLQEVADASLEHGCVAHASCPLIGAHSRQHPVAGEVPEPRKLTEIDVRVLCSYGERLNRLDQSSAMREQQPSFCLEPRASLATGAHGVDLSRT